MRSQAIQVGVHLHPAVTRRR